MLRTLLSRVRSSQGASAKHRLHALDRVRLIGALVVAVSPHAGEAQGDAAGIARRDLHAVERDLDDLLGLDVHDVAVATGALADLEFEEALGLPPEEIVGETLERLSDHHPFALRASRRKVQVREPSPAATVAPL